MTVIIGQITTPRCEELRPPAETYRYTMCDFLCYADTPYTPGQNEWGGIFGCLEDPGGCILTSCCPCITVCEIGEKLGMDVKIGGPTKQHPAPTFTSGVNQCINWCSFNSCCCPGDIAVLMYLTGNKEFCCCTCEPAARCDHLMWHAPARHLAHAYGASAGCVRARLADHVEIMTAVANKLGKKTRSPGPCDSAVLQVKGTPRPPRDPGINSPHLDPTITARRQVCCCGSCTLCLLQREMRNSVKPAPGGGPPAAEPEEMKRYEA